MTDMIEQAQLAGYELADRYRLENGRVFLSGLQAIARLPLDQIRSDRRRGLNTAAFVSGYQGSPVGAFGDEVERAARTVADLPIVCQPGANEELAATAVMGSQLASTLVRLHLRRRHRHVVRQGARTRSGQRRHPPRRVRRHVRARWRRGARRRRPGCQVVDAAVVERRHDGRPPHADLLPRRRAGGARSRAATPSPCRASCGLWAGIKLVSQVADGTGTVDIHPDRVVPQVPTMIFDGKPFVPHPNGRSDDAVHARHGARVLRGALRARPRVRRAQPPQPGHGAQRRRLDRHRRLRHDVLRGARDAPVARARRRRRDPRPPASACSSC